MHGSDSEEQLLAFFINNKKNSYVTRFYISSTFVPPFTFSARPEQIQLTGPLYVAL
jgi:hypothetical protein